MQAFFFFLKPIRYPGIMNLISTAQTSQQIKGVVAADVKIVRSVSGLNLKVLCYLFSGNYIGSCFYNDLCLALQKVFDLNQNNCPNYLLYNGIDCTCPFNLPVRPFYINDDFDLPDRPMFSNSISPSSFLAFYLLNNGDFSIDVKLTQGSTSILCMNFKYSMKPK